MSNTRRPEGGSAGPKKKKKRSFRWLLYLFLLMVGIGLGVGAWGASFVYKAWKALPAYEDFDPSLTSYVYDSKGKEVYKLSAEENRTLVSIKEIPIDVQNAFIASEDIRFREHFGIDLYAIGRALWVDFLYLIGQYHQIEGASTITQQLTRNAWLTQEQTLMRKVQEALIAIQLERRFTKEEILEKYLNQIYFANNAYGLQAAAQTYFQKNAKDLTLSEGALLATIIKNPSRFDPFVNYKNALARRSDILDQMVMYKMIDPARGEQLKKEQPKVSEAEVTPRSTTFTGDHYVDYVLRILTDPNLNKKYGVPLFEAEQLYRKGLKIYTTLDLEMQKVADEKVKTIIPQAAKEWGVEKKPPQAAVVMLDPRNGHVKALVGGTSHKQMRELNRATDTLRQPGSTIKPIVAYAPAIDMLGWGPATVLDDSPPMLSADKKNVWPENYEFEFAGLKPMRFAVEQSINGQAVRALMAVTPRKAIDYAKKMGLSTLVESSQNPRVNDENLALTLGGITNGTSVLEMTSAYGTLANMGTQVDPVIITRIENRYGEVIFSAQPRKKAVLKPEAAWLMVDIMKGVIKRGTAYWETKGFNGWPAAAKTGTTEDWADAWVIGFTPELVTGVWTGYDNNEGKQTLPRQANGVYWTGAGPPTRIWNAIMTTVVKEQPKDWPMPGKITSVQVCKTSGLLPSPLCPPNDIVKDYFIRGTEPTKIDDVWTMAKVVKQTVPHPDPRLAAQKKTAEKFFLWKEGCPGTPTTQLFIKRPTTYVKHPTEPFFYKSNGYPKYLPKDWVLELPTEYCQVQQGQQDGSIITLPNLPGVTPPGGTTPPPGGTTPPPGGGTTTPPGGLQPVPPPSNSKP